MNHWFLVARDLMWLAIFFMPLYLSAGAVYWSTRKDEFPDNFRESSWMLGAIILQVVLCGSLWGDIIK